MHLDSPRLITLALSGRWAYTSNRYQAYWQERYESPGPGSGRSYNYSIVGLSVVIAVVASYAALDLAEQLTAARGRSVLWWLTGGAATMGIGVGSMPPQASAHGPDGELKSPAAC